jgi:transposase
MEMNEYIRFAHHKLGHGIRKISRDTGLDRKTIRRALNSASTGPEYKLSATRPKTVMGPFIEQIREWILQDRRAPRKQRHTAERIHQRLQAELGFQGSLSTTQVAVRKIKGALDPGRKEVFIPSDPEKREGAEMDWGELYVDLNDKRTKVHLFAMRSKFSGKVYARLYPVMVQECFFDGHIRAFAYFDRVFGKIIYDNLKSAVKQVMRGRERIEQDAFIQFRSHYSYEAQFCSICKGSEKGGVEGAVGYVRRNFLTPIPNAKTLDELNDFLLEKCLAHDVHLTAGQERTVGELYEEEISKLLQLPRMPYRNYKLHSGMVDKYLTVRINRNRYSVPAGYREKAVILEIGLSDVRIIHENILIATHKREFLRDRWVINPWHYLEALQRKPGAFQSSRILSEMEHSWDPVVKKVYDLQIKKYGEIDGTKEFISTLLCFKDRSYEEMIEVLKLSLEQKTINKETVELIADAKDDDDSLESATTAHIAAIANFSIPEADVDRFDVLMEVANG